MNILDKKTEGWMLPIAAGSMVAFFLIFVSLILVPKTNSQSVEEIQPCREAEIERFPSIVPTDGNMWVEYKNGKYRACKVYSTTIDCGDWAKP